MSYLEYNCFIIKELLKNSNPDLSIYETEKIKCQSMEDSTLISFMDAWILDIYQEKHSIGPNFTDVYIYYYTNTEKEIADDNSLNKLWLQEAAVRDYILSCNRLESRINILKKDLEKYPLIFD